MWKKTSLLSRPCSSPHPGIGIGTRKGAEDRRVPSGATCRHEIARKLAEATARTKTAVIHLPPRKEAKRWDLAGASKRGLRGDGARRGGLDMSRGSTKKDSEREKREKEKKTLPPSSLSLSSHPLSQAKHKERSVVASFALSSLSCSLALSLSSCSDLPSSRSQSRDSHRSY